MAIIKVTDTDMKAVRSASDALREYFADRSLTKNRTVTYDIRTYGCQLNESDSEKLVGMLESMGLMRTSGPDADIIIFNTCSVRENAEDRLFGNLGEIKSLKKKDRDIIVVVCGCMMKVPENVERIRKSFPYVDLVFDPQPLHMFPKLLLGAIRKNKQLIDISEDDYLAEDSLVPISRARKFRALVPIMYGCNNFCTYCIVPYARGRERSRQFDQIVEELQSLADQGFKEIMLLGQNVNSYSDSDGHRFPDVLKAAAEINGFSRVRFMSSHPKDLSDEVIELMASYPNIEKHLHLAMQSGSDRVLSRMNRPYKIDDFMRIVDLFRSKIPDGSISTDIIVGFPGETEEDFQATLDAVKRAQFDSAFTFQYSKRPGTAAADFPDQIDHDTVTERFGRLLDIQNDLAYRSNLSKVGKVEEVLIEGESSTAPDILTGRTRSNHLINFTVNDDLKLREADGSFCPSSKYEGLLCNVLFTSARPYSVDGVMESWIND